MSKIIELSELRKKIDDLDREIVKILEKRYAIAEDVAAYKEANNLPIYNREREEEVIKKNLDYLQEKEYEDEVRKTFVNIMEFSKDIQIRKIKRKCRSTNATEKILGFQGVEGSFSHEALLDYFSDYKELKKYEEFEDVFIAINKGEIDYGIIPMDNSSTGEIADAYDLVRKYGNYIIGEIALQVEQNLLGLPGTKLEDIKEVYSHPQAFYQSSEFLKKHPQWKWITYPNTAASAKYVKVEGDKTKAAIASMNAKKFYDLEVIEKGISYNKNNSTRFVIIGRELELSNKSNKVSIITSTPHKAGGLFGLIQIFAKKGLNMLSIKSRPMLDRPWEYFFYIDFEGNLENEETKAAIEEIKNTSSYFKVLGNYKKDIHIL